MADPVATFAAAYEKQIEGCVVVAIADSRIMRGLIPPGGEPEARTS